MSHNTVILNLFWARTPPTFENLMKTLDPSTYEIAQTLHTWTFKGHGDPHLWSPGWQELCLPCRHAATLGPVPGVMLSASANGESMGGPWWMDRSDVLLCGCGTGRPGLRACLLWPVLWIPHESPVADVASWAWEQLCVAWPHRWNRSSPTQPSALPRSAAGLSHCSHGLRLGCGPGEWSRESNWPLAAYQAFPLWTSLADQGIFSSPPYPGL